MRVDLILAEEQRSATLVSLGFIARTAVMIAVLAAVGAGAVLYLKSSSETRKRDILLRRWKELEPQHAKFLAEKKRFDYYAGLRDELRRMKECRMDWAAQLALLRDVIPDTVQLTGASFSEGVKQLDGMPARVPALSIHGRAEGETAGKDVEKLRQTLERESALAKHLAGARVTLFTGARWSGAKPTDREFEIVCDYKPIRCK